MDLKSELIRFIERAVQTAKYDKTVKGVIVSASGNDRYTMKMAGAEYSAPCLSSATQFKKGDAVWILLPHGQIADAVIIGRRQV